MQAEQGVESLGRGRLGRLGALAHEAHAVLLAQAAAQRGPVTRPHVQHNGVPPPAKACTHARQGQWRRQTRQRLRQAALPTF